MMLLYRSKPSTTFSRLPLTTFSLLPLTTFSLLFSWSLLGCSETAQRPLSDAALADATIVRDGPGHNDSKPQDDGSPPPRDSGPAKDAALPPPASCQAAGGSAQVSKPTLAVTYKDRWHEGWLSSPAVADIDGNGQNEVIVAREGLVVIWKADGTLVRTHDCGGRIWSPVIVADLVSGRPGLEIIAAARGKIFGWDASGKALAGFPINWKDEIRGIAAGDIDGDGALELVAVTTRSFTGGGQRDLLTAFEANGQQVAGFPPNTSGSAGCDDKCYTTGGFDQNIAVGDITGDHRAEIFATHDNAYMSLHEGTGRAFDAASIFKDRKKFMGIRFFLDYALSQKGWSSNEQRDNQAHFTNSAPALADIDGDGKRELVVLGSVQNAAQSDRERGVVLYVLESDGQRPAAWVAPYHAPDYLAGLNDFQGTNVVGATNQVSVADIDPDKTGPELLFAGFDGHIHCVSADNKRLWRVRYTNDPRVLTGGVVVADLSADGRPEIVFNTYSPDEGKSHLFVLDAAGNQLHKIKLPKRGAMTVPTIADVDGDGTLEILVSLKDGEDKKQSVLSYTVAGSKDNCLLWPTGRGNLHRNGAI
jgi:hypothetical protein